MDVTITQTFKKVLVFIYYYLRAMTDQLKDGEITAAET